MQSDPLLGSLTDPLLRCQGLAFKGDPLPAVVHELADVLVVGGIGMVEYRLIVLCKKEKRILLAKIIQLGKGKYLGAALVLGRFIVSGSVPESGWLVLVPGLYKFDHFFKGSGMGLQFFQQRGELLFHAPKISN